MQTSIPLHASASAQGMSFGTCTHICVVSLHVSVVHESMSLQLRGAPAAHRPVASVQVSAPLQNMWSSHAVSVVQRDVHPRIGSQTCPAGQSASSGVWAHVPAWQPSVVQARWSLQSPHMTSMCASRALASPASTPASIKARQWPPKQSTPAGQTTPTHAASRSTRTVMSLPCTNALGTTRRTRLAPPRVPLTVIVTASDSWPARG